MAKNNGRYTLICTEEIDSAHYLVGYKGKCATLHGHRWKIEIAVSGTRLDPLGMLVDFGQVKEIVNELDHKCLNNIPPFLIDPAFDVVNPTAENIAQFLGQKILDSWFGRGVGNELDYVKIWETPNNVVIWTPDRE